MQETIHGWGRRSQAKSWRTLPRAPNFLPNSAHKDFGFVISVRDAGPRFEAGLMFGSRNGMWLCWRSEIPHHCVHDQSCLDIRSSRRKGWCAQSSSFCLADFLRSAALRAGLRRKEGNASHFSQSLPLQRTKRASGDCNRAKLRQRASRINGNTAVVMPQKS